MVYIPWVYRYKQEGAKFESQRKEIFSSINTPGPAVPTYCDTFQDVNRLKRDVGHSYLAGEGSFTGDPER